MATYEDLLSTPVDKIEKPVPPPPGHYLFAVESFEPVTSAFSGQRPSPLHDGANE